MPYIASRLVFCVPILTRFNMRTLLLALIQCNSHKTDKVMFSAIIKSLPWINTMVQKHLTYISHTKPESDRFQHNEINPKYFCCGVFHWKSFTLVNNVYKLWRTKSGCKDTCCTCQLGELQNICPIRMCRMIVKSN